MSRAWQSAAAANKFAKLGSGFRKITPFSRTVICAILQNLLSCDVGSPNFGRSVRRSVYLLSYVVKKQRRPVPTTRGPRTKKIHRSATSGMDGSNKASSPTVHSHHYTIGIRVTPASPEIDYAQPISPPEPTDLSDLMHRGGLLVVAHSCRDMLLLCALLS